MRFCTNCGAQLEDTAKFCTECGQRIEKAAPAAQVPVSVTSAEVHVYGQPVNHSFSEPAISETEQGVVHTYGAPVSHNFAPPVQAEAALSGTYGAAAAQPVFEPAAKPEPVTVAATTAHTVSEPAAYTTPTRVSDSGTYSSPEAAPEKTSKLPKVKLPEVKMPAVKMPEVKLPAGKLPKVNIPKQINIGGKQIRTSLVAVLVIVIVVGLFSCVGGGGDSDDSNLGVYNAVSCTYGGFELSAEGEWIELKSGGKLKMNLMGDEYSGKWELDGEDLTMTQAGDTFYGTLRDGTLVLDLSGMIYTYEKEATEIPATPNKTPKETTAPVPSSPEVGYWTLKYSEGDESMAMDEETVAMLAEMGIVIYVDLAEDGTGTVMLEEAMPITWGDGKMVADDGSEVSYTLENGELIVDAQGALMHFVPGEKSSETVVSPSGDLLVNELTYYMAISGNMSGTEMNDSAIAQMGGMDIALNGDGTGTLNMFGSFEEITYDNDAIYRSGVPMEYELDGYYLYLKMSDAVEFTMMVENKAKNRPKDELTPNDLFYWKGDYYGWWVYDNVIEGNTDAQGTWWDCCMTLDIFTNGAGYITIWDEEYGKDDPIAKVEVSVSVTDGVARIVSESGDFMGCEVKHADWLFYSDATGYEDTLGFYAMYEDPDTKIDCYFFMRQWGTIWDDVEEKDLPGYYESWYLPLIKDGEVIAPRTIG